MKTTTDTLDELLALYQRVEELMNPGMDVRSYLETWRAELTLSQQRRGILASFGDIADQCRYMSADEIRRIDDVLAAEGLMTLSGLILRHGRRVKRLLKAKRLRSEDEAILLNDAIEAGVLTPDEARTAHALISSFAEGQ